MPSIVPHIFYVIARKYKFMNSRLIAILFVVAAAFFAGCANQSGEETPEGGAAQVVTAEWTPDGEVSKGEYALKYEAPRDEFSVSWKNDAEYFYMAIEGKTEGWVAIGFDPAEWMKDADMVIGGVDGGEAYVRDAYSVERYGPHPPDPDLGGADDVVEFGGSEKDGRTVIEFKRNMATGDVWDKAFVPGQTVKMIWATSESDDSEMRHIIDGKGTLTFQ